jgi:hypothetical protein
MIVRAVVPSHPIELGRDLDLLIRISLRMHKDAHVLRLYKFMAKSTVYGQVPCLVIYRIERRNVGRLGFQSFGVRARPTAAAYLAISTSRFS